MSYIPIIQRSDFTQYVKIGVNIKQSELDVHIKDVQELDFLSWCDTPFYNDVMNIGESTVRPELLSLINEYIKPYLICGAYYNFLLWAGRDVTQAGIRIELSESSQDIGDKARAEIMANVLNKKNIYLAKLKNKLYNDSYTYDSIQYTFFDEPNKTSPVPQLGIKKAGKTKKYFDKKTCTWL